MATVAYDDRSFTIDGRRIRLVSGAVHYFRMPAALWRDRLAKALRGGLNCVETYVAWNVHEPVEGAWDFDGDKNVAEFIQQAGDLGLYVIVRPGPYICSEWEFGGLPGWLRAKANVQVRCPNAVYTHYYDKYFRQLLPRLVDLQVSRGGNIIAIQNENEYFNRTMPDRLEYLTFISMLYRRAGFDIPILTCNGLTEPLVEGAVECLNGWGRANSQVKALRHMQPDKPLLATEFWCGWFDAWAGPHARKDPRQTARRAMELVGGGAQLNYYMYCGGTNFGFRAGRTVGSDHMYMTTSYDFDAPIAEGGGLTRKYYLLRLVNLMNSRLGGVLASAAPLPSAASLDGPASYACSGPHGTVTVVSNGGDDRMETTSVALPDGRVLEADLRHCGAAALFQDATVTDQHVLDYSNLMPLGVFGAGVLILHGGPGQAGVLSVNGVEARVEVPDGPKPASLEAGGLKILVMTSALAERVWEVDGEVLIGPAFVGEAPDEVVFDASTKQYHTLDEHGALQTHRLRAKKKAPAPKPPALSRWEPLGAAPEAAGEAGGFKRIDRVGAMTAQGVTSGYGWYRVPIELKRAARKNLFLPGCEDRARLLVNGKPAGVWGRGDGARRTPLSVALASGVNELTMLVDDLGRFNFGPHLGEAKGVWDDIYTASLLRPKGWTIGPGSDKDFPRRIVPRHLLYVADELRGAAPMAAETSFTLTRQAPVHLQFTDMDQTVAVFCNDRPVGFFPALPGGFGDVLLKREVNKGANTLKLLIWPEATAKQLNASMTLYRLDENLTAGARWSFAPWAPPSGPTGAIVAGAPSWFRAAFKAPKASTPLFVRVRGASKGQIFLNGRNLGRFWTIGPQETYYLPGPWLAETNELLIFSEDGAAPTGTSLEYRPLGPYGE